jgi:hypothetical protein
MIWARLWRYELDEENLNLDSIKVYIGPWSWVRVIDIPLTSSTTLSPLSPYSEPSSVQPENTRTASFQQEESQVINLFWVYCKSKRALIFSWTTAGSSREIQFQQKSNPINPLVPSSPTLRQVFHLHNSSPNNARKECECILVVEMLCCHLFC